jgi:hypothetical protein
MKKLTLSELKRRKTVKVKRIVNQLSVDEMRTQLVKLLNDNNLPLDRLQENERQFSYDTHVWLKPTMPDSIEGIITFRSKDYYFTYIKDGKEVNSYGEIKAENLTENGFYLTMYNGNKIIYEIIE